MRELDKEVASGRMRLPEGLGNDEFVRRRHRVHLGAAYADEIWRLAHIGCTYLQLDDTSLAYLNDPAQRAEIGRRGEDAEHQHETCTSSPSTGPFAASQPG